MDGTVREMVIIRNMVTIDPIAAVAAPAATAVGLSLARGRRTVVADATFTIPTGAVTALIGPNGAGKSTVLDAIAGLLAAQAGSLEVPALAAPGRRRLRPPGHPRQRAAARSPSARP